MEKKALKAALNTAIAPDAERKLEEMQTSLRRKGAKRNPTAKNNLIELLIMMPKAEEYLESQIIA